MFDYVFSASLPQIHTDASPVWSRSALSSLSPGLLTPFSYSMMAEILRRGWYAYFDSLGCTPKPVARLVRQHTGRAYLNLSISAELDAQLGIEPLALRINGQRQPLAPWSKPGLLSGLLNRPQRKIDKVIAEMTSELDTVTQRAEEWYHKTGRLRWSQAEILQVMEEIERVGLHSLRIFFAARHNLMLLYNRILWATEERAPFPQNLAALQGALGALPGLTEGALVESTLAAAVIPLGDLPSSALEPGSTHPQMDAFLQAYGHRGMNEGEIRQPRWHEDASLLWKSARASADQRSRFVLHQTAGESMLQPLLNATAENQQKEVRQWLEQIAHLMQMQSRALHAYAYVRAGTRRWALAAAQEAMSDGRMTSQDDVFFFELEQVKEMMTGEWNISALAEIQAHAKEQRARYTEWQQIEASPLLIGDSEAEPVADLPGGPGRAVGPFVPVSVPDGLQVEPFATEPIIGAQPLDSGSAALLSIAHGIAGAAAPFDPVVAAASIHQIPCVLTSAPQVRAYTAGAKVAVDGDRGTILVHDS